MPIRKVTLNKVTAIMVGNIISLLSGGKGHRYHQRNFLSRILKEWPELDPERGDGGLSVEASVTREVDFHPEEQTAIAFGLVDLATGDFWPTPHPDGRSRKVTTADVNEVRKVAAACGSGIVKFFDTHLQADKVEPFEGTWEEDAVLTE